MKIQGYRSTHNYKKENGEKEKIDRDHLHHSTCTNLHTIIFVITCIPSDFKRLQ